MPCCIDRMRFSPRFSIWRKKHSLFFSFLFFCQVEDLYASGLFRARGFFWPVFGEGDLATENTWSGVILNKVVETPRVSRLRPDPHPEVAQR